MGWKSLLAGTAAALLIAASLLAQDLNQDLPDAGPTPLKKPAEIQQPPSPAQAPSPAQPVAPPLPETKPEEAEQSPPVSDELTKAETVPPPEAKPETAPAAPPDKPADTIPQQTEPAEPIEPPVTIEPESEADLKACMAELTAIGARFEVIPRIDDSGGCGIDKPIRIDRLLPDVALAPEDDMRCETALQLARFVQQSIIPAASIGLPDSGKLTSVNHAASYVCRKRNGAETGKISEHARGNAVDIVSLSFGRQIVPMRIVKLEDSTIEDAFQRAINATACLFFKTVLSPGSDAAHQDHMHLDVLERRGGYRYCR